MPPSVTATLYQDPGEDSLATSQLPLPMLRTIPSASAIRTAARLISRAEAAFFRRLFLATDDNYHT